VEYINRLVTLSIYAINDLLSHNALISFNPGAWCVRGTGKASGDTV